MATLRKARTTALRSGETVAQQPVGRMCTAPGCITRLSRYNPRPTCSVHAGWQDSPKDRRSNS